ncbi:hypothetical protein IPU70_01685 [Achromobacter sp. SD115]|uniref:hypothetical protein n=1 Tax=Achromobacter sp. SD115 TaxID=2782011 RepID=UPI001A97CFC5|nr:hypothetical protein [Achromobacter sp. SD115]MBO1012243.1 hypothetical protein [Achromobacter sp. SD115]
MRPTLDPSLAEPAAQFLLRFSRLEFALKENRYFTTGSYNSAQVDWKEFYKKHRDTYRPCPAGADLTSLAPLQQIVNEHGELDWAARLDLAERPELVRDCELLKTVRNNLFHGGKHGDPQVRTAELLQVCITLMDQIGEQFFPSDYAGIY